MLSERTEAHCSLIRVLRNPVGPLGQALDQCLLSRAYRRFDHPGTLPQCDGRARPAVAGCLVGRHRHLEILDAGQVLNDFLAINGPHVDAIQEVSSGAPGCGPSRFFFPHRHAVVPRPKRLLSGLRLGGYPPRVSQDGMFGAFAVNEEYGLTPSFG